MRRKFHCTAVYDTSSLVFRCIILLIFVFGQSLHVSWFLLPLYKFNTEKSNSTFKVLTTIWFILSFLWLWSYISTCWMDAGSIENELYKRGFIDLNGQLKENLTLPTEIGEFPRCDRCHLPKPPRTHHCSQCGKCYYRFDHHCEIIGNCVAFRNMKSFMLLLLYSSILFFLAAITSIISYKITKNVDLSYILTAWVLAICIGGIIFLFGIVRVPDVCVNNMTTLERIAGNNPKTYDAGLTNNIKQTFGECPILWIFPTRPSITLFD